MSLADCIAKAGDSLSPEDKTFLEEQIAGGMEGDLALTMLQERVNSDLGMIAQQVTNDGGEVKMKDFTPDEITGPTKPTLPYEYLAQTYEAKSEIFYSAAERAIDTMKVQGFEPSKKNPDGAARGQDIWNKFKSMQLKKEEIEWLGLEEYLTNDPNEKFTRDNVKSFIERNGVTIIETIADDQNVRDSGALDLNDPMEDDDAREHEITYRTEMYMEDFSPGDDSSWFFDQSEQKDYIGRQLSDFRNEFDENDFDSEEDFESAAEQIDDADTWADAFEVLENYGFDLYDRYSVELNERAEELARESAEQDWLNEPQYIWSDSIDGTEFRITGNSEMGYTTYIDGEYSTEHMDIDDARAEMVQEAEDRGLTTEGSQYHRIQQGSTSYQMRGDRTNYREVKIKLPDIDPEFKYEAHYSDPNIALFLRVDDRKLHPGGQEPLTEWENRDTEHPENLQHRKKLREQYNEEKMEEYFEESKANLIEFYEKSGAPMDLINWERLNDYHNWAHIERIGKVHNERKGDYDSFEDKFDMAQVRRKQLLEEIEINNKEYNTEKAKRERSGKTGVDTYFIDEMQSDWQTAGRQKGFKSGNSIQDLQEQLDRDGISLNIKAKGMWWSAVHGGPQSIDPKKSGSQHYGKYIFFKSDTGEQLSFEDWEAYRGDKDHMQHDSFVARVLDYLASDGEATYGAAKLIKGVVERSHHDEGRLRYEAKHLQELREAIDRERSGVTPAPFVKDDAWIALGLKRALIQAAEKGYKAIAWPNSQVLRDRWSESYEYRPQYDQKMGGIIKRLTKQEPMEIVRETNEPREVIKEPRVDVSTWKYENTEPGSHWTLEIPEIGFKDVIRTDKTAEKDFGAIIIPKFERHVRMLEFYDVRQNAEGNWYARDKKNGDMVGDTYGDMIESGDKFILMDRLVRYKYNKHYPKQEQGYWIVPITDELRGEIKSKGYPMFQGERGRFYPGQTDNIIQLTKTSDLTTFLHEGAHLFLEIQKVWTEKYGVTANQQAMLDWLGIESFNQLDRDKHEIWAETFEVYLREGKAPSLQLRQAFAAFSRWLKKIYRTLTDGRLINAKIDDDIRNIFNRMLATEEAIAEAAARPEYDQYFRNQQQAGMTDKQWEEYTRRVSKMKDQAELTVDEKVLKQYMRTKQAAWAREREPIVAEERARLQATPIYQVLSNVQGDKFNNIPAVPFDTASLKLLYPDGIPKRLAFKHKSEGGIDPQWYAEQYGFASDVEMLDQLMNTPPLKKAAEIAAETRMIQKYGDIMKDGTLENEAREALMNENQAEILMMEISASAQGRRAGINREYLKGKAINTIAKMTFKEIKPSRFYRAMVKHAKDSMIMRDPTDAKIGQLANHYLYKEGVRVRDQMEKHRRYVRSVSTRTFDTKKIDPDYAQQMKMLSEMYEMRQSPAQEVQLSNLLNFYEAQQRKIGDDETDLTLLDPNLIRAIEYRDTHGGNLAGFQIVQFEDMTAQDLHGVVDMLKHLSFVGREIAGTNNEAAILSRMEFTESVRKEGGKDYPVQRNRQVPLKSAREKWNYMYNTMPSLINMTRKLDGFKAGGEAFRKVLMKLNDANDKKLQLNQQYYKEFEQMVGPMAEIKLSRWDAKSYALQDGTEVSFSSEEVFMMGLYWGTESSREAIRQAWNMTDQDVMGILSTMSQDQLRYLNILWNLNETHWPELQQAALLKDGYAPPKLERTPFTVNGVELTGGHMQLYYDSQRIDLKTDREIGTRKGSVMPTKAGSLNARVGSGGQPVKLDVNNITRSIDDKIHYIAFAQAGRDLRRLLVNPEVVGAIERKHGSGFYQAYMEAIEAITSNRGAQESHKTLAAMMKWMRSSATMMHLMYSVRNTAQQFSAIPIAIEEVGLVRYVDAVGKFLSNNREMVRMVNSKSKFMENRKELVNRDSREAMRKMIRTSKMGAAYETMIAYGFMLQTTVDSTVAYPTWLAAYNKAMEDHGMEKQARLEADAAVGESVGSGSDLQLGRIMQSNQGEITKTITVFGSWFNAYYQRLYKNSKGGTDYLNPKFGVTAVLMPLIAANIAQALILDLPDEDETVIDWMIKNGYVFMLGTVPLLREIASFQEGFTPSAPVMALPKALVRIPDELQAYSDLNQTGLKTTVDVGRAVAAVARVPGSGQALRILDYVDSYLNGEEGDFNPYQMFVEGADKNE